MINPLIVGAVIVQWIAGKVSRIAGAVLGYVITTGILVWGLSLYTQGDAIAFFGIQMSQVVFIVLCLVWYAFDTREFLRARKLSENGAEREDIYTEDDHSPTG